jgi:hypothetical protein
MKIAAPQMKPFAGTIEFPAEGTVTLVRGAEEQFIQYVQG